VLCSTLCGCIIRAARLCCLARRNLDTTTNDGNHCRCKPEQRTNAYRCLTSRQCNDDRNPHPYNGDDAGEPFRTSSQPELDAVPPKASRALARGDFNPLPKTHNYRPCSTLTCQGTTSAFAKSSYDSRSSFVSSEAGSHRAANRSVASFMGSLRPCEIPETSMSRSAG
jgi:hypothetical protein